MNRGSLTFPYYNAGLLDLHVTSSSWSFSCRMRCRQWSPATCSLAMQLKRTVYWHTASSVSQICLNATFALFFNFSWEQGPNYAQLPVVSRGVWGAFKGQSNPGGTSMDDGYMSRWAALQYQGSWKQLDMDQALWLMSLPCRNMGLDDKYGDVFCMNLALQKGPGEVVYRAPLHLF